MVLPAIVAWLASGKTFWAWTGAGTEELPRKPTHTWVGSQHEMKIGEG
jgi:hypothetical protein